MLEADMVVPPSQKQPEKSKLAYHTQISHGMKQIKSHTLVSS